MIQIDEEGRRLREILPLDGMRGEICRRMTESIQNFPQGTGSVFLDVTKLIQFRTELKEQGHNVTFGDLYVKATACALEENMRINAAHIGNDSVYYDSINLGMMTYFYGVLMEPVLVDANAKDVLEISEELKKIYGYLQKGRLMRVPLEGSTFSVSNMGTKLMDAATPLLSPPRAGILGIGRMVQTPAFDENDNIVKKSVCCFSLTVDHGLVDGMMVCDFFESINRVLQDPWTYMYQKASLTQGE